MRLNAEQTKGLANFFFDIAKGLVLGGLGYSAVIPSQAKIAIIIVSLFAAYLCVRSAMIILDKFND